MIDVTKMNGGSITVNADLIETVEETPDTIITLTTGKKKFSVLYGLTAGHINFCRMIFATTFSKGIRLLQRRVCQVF